MFYYMFMYASLLQTIFKLQYCNDVGHGRIVLAGWVLLSAVSVSCCSGQGITNRAEKPAISWQQIIFYILSLNLWFNRSYTKGLTAELNRNFTSAVANRMAPL